MISGSNGRIKIGAIIKQIFAPLLIALIMLFCSAENSTHTFSIRINAIYIGAMVFVILFASSGLIIVKNRGVVRFDIVAALLLVRMIYSTFIVFAFNDSENLANYLASILSFFSYFYFLNYKQLDYRAFSWWIKAIFWILVIQTMVVVFRLLMLGQSMYGFKTLIQIPVGGSNAIATYIVMFLPILYKQENEKGIMKMIYMLIAFLAVLLTRSTSGFVCLLMIMIVMLIQERQHKALKIMAFFLGGIFVVYSISYFSSDYLQRIFNNLLGILESSVDSLNNVSNGRTEIWLKCVELWKSNPLLGVGFSYRKYVPNECMAHNWVLEALVSGGIISAILLMAAFFNVSKKLVLNIKCNNTKNLIFLYVLLGVLVQGLFEPSIGTFRFDTMLWAILGFAMNICANDYSTKTMM